VRRESKNETRLNGSLTQVEQLYESFKKQAGAIDTTLSRHVDALKLKTVKNLQELEKKMFRAEKRKFADSRTQIQLIKSHLFPGGGLQERYENISYYYAKFGKAVIDILYENSLQLESEFVILEEK
jgi:bacillithiol synthase